MDVRVVLTLSASTRKRTSSSLRSYRNRLHHHTCKMQQGLTIKSKCNAHNYDAALYVLNACDSAICFDKLRQSFTTFSAWEHLTHPATSRSACLVRTTCEAMKRQATAKLGGLHLRNKNNVGEGSQIKQSPRRGNPKHTRQASKKPDGARCSLQGRSTKSLPHHHQCRCTASYTTTVCECECKCVVESQTKQ